LKSTMRNLQKGIEQINDNVRMLGSVVTEMEKKSGVTESAALKSTGFAFLSFSMLDILLLYKQ
jgi:hypothetical protein